MGKDPTFTKKKQKRKQEIDLDPAEAKEMNKINQEADYIVRQSKNKRKQKKLRVFNVDVNGPTVPKKQKKKSSFESELVNTSAKSVKAFRHVANKKKSDDRRMKKKGKPGGNFGKKSSFK